MMQYGHIYAAICIMIKLKVMFWKLYTRVYFNEGTFNYCFISSVTVAYVQALDNRPIIFIIEIVGLPYCLIP